MSNANRIPVAYIVTVLQEGQTDPLAEVSLYRSKEAALQGITRLSRTYGEPEDRITLSEVYQYEDGPAPPLRPGACPYDLEIWGSAVPPVLGESRFMQANRSALLTMAIPGPRVEGWPR